MRQGQGALSDGPLSKVVVVAIFPEPCRSDFSCRPVPVLTVDLHAKATILQGEGKTREGEKEKNEERERETGNRAWRGEGREKKSELPMACGRGALEFV